MTSNDNDKHKLEEEAESSMVRKRLWLSDDNASDNDSSDSPKEEIEEEETEETSINQLDTSEEKLFAKHGRGMIFSDYGDTTSPSSEQRTPKSHRHSDEDSSDNDNDFWMLINPE
jgi:phage repressor protein C with HTH and peptisase S24 domain